MMIIPISSGFRVHQNDSILFQTIKNMVEYKTEVKYRDLCKAKATIARLCNTKGSVTDVTMSKHIDVDDVLVCGTQEEDKYRVVIKITLSEDDISRELSKTKNSIFQFATITLYDYINSDPVIERTFAVGDSGAFITDEGKLKKEFVISEVR